MKNKECFEVIKKICAYMDDEADNKCCEMIENHLKECDSCRDEYDSMKRILLLCRKSREHLDDNEKSALKSEVMKLIEKE